MSIYSHNNIFLKNESTCEYYKIIELAQQENRKKHRKTHPEYVYYESHHVLPRSIFPEYAKEKWNIVLLTAREHLTCHQLLVKMIEKSKPYFQMVCAYQSMAFRKTKDMPRVELTPEEYESLRIQFSEAKTILGQKPCKEETKIRIGKANKGRKQSPEAIAKSRNSRIGLKRSPESIKASADAQRGNKNCLGKTWWNNGVTQTMTVDCPGPEWVKGKLPITEETRGRMRIANAGRVQSETANQARREKMTGYKWPDEFGKKISASKKGVKTNQQEIMGRRYAMMSDEEFLVHKSKMKSLLAKNRATNLRIKWLNTIVFNDIIELSKNENI